MSSRPYLCAVLLLALLGAPPPLAQAGEPPPASRPDGRNEVSLDRTVDILSLSLDLRLDVTGGSISGSATHRVKALRTGLREIRLHAVGLDVQQVTIDGEPTPFRLLPEQLAIALPGPSDPSAELSVAVTYQATPQQGLHFRRPGPESSDTYTEVWSQGENTDNRHWFPTWDAPDDRFVYTGRFTAEERFSVLSNGRLTRRAPAEPGWTTWTYALQDQDLVSYLVMVAAGEYKALGREWRGRPVLDLYPPDADEGAVRRATERVPEMLDFMSSATGVEYPYPGYSQVFVQRFIYTGMENTTATVLYRWLLYPEREAPHAWRRTEAVLAHELAHQWFGDQITLRDWSHMWLNEGMTTFLEGWWTRYAHGPEVGADRLFRRYRSVIASDERSARPLVVDFHSRDGGRLSHNHYNKGASLMEMLRVLLGEEDFGRAFRRYSKERQHTNVDTGDLQRIVEDTTGLALDWFFQQWVELAGHPRLAVEHAIDAEEGTLRVTVTQSQEVGGLVPLFTLPVDLAVVTDAGTVRRRLWLDRAESASVVLDLGGALQFVAVDPDGGLLADIVQTQTDVEWAAQLTQGDLHYARRSAFHAVSERKGPPSEALRAVVTGLLADGAAHSVWRRQAAATLGAWTDAASRAALVAALGGPGVDADPTLQEAIIDALGEGESDPDVIAAMRAIWGRAGTDQVRASALQVLGKLLTEAAAPELRRALGGAAGHGEILHYVAVSGLGAHGDRKDIQRLARYRAPSNPHRLRTTAFLASSKIAERQPSKRERERAREPIARDAERALGDLNLRMVQAAVRVLGTVGDARSIPALQALQTTSTVPAVRDAAEAAVEQIRTRKDPDPNEDDAAITARLKTLEEQLAELQGKLQTIEERE